MMVKELYCRNETMYDDGSELNIAGTSMISGALSMALCCKFAKYVCI
jgi:hypothetical protein